MPDTTPGHLWVVPYVVLTLGAVAAAIGEQAYLVPSLVFSLTWLLVSQVVWRIRRKRYPHGKTTETHA